MVLGLGYAFDYDRKAFGNIFWSGEDLRFLKKNSAQFLYFRGLDKFTLRECYARYVILKSLGDAKCYLSSA